MGVAIADRLSAEGYGERVVEDLRARAWGRTANALRATSDLAGAEQALATAARHLKLGSGEPLEEAEHLYFTASLHRAERRLDEALRAIHRSRRIYRMVGDRHLEGRSLMCEAAIRDLRGEPKSPWPVAAWRGRRSSPERNRRLALAAHHNLVWQLMCAGQARGSDARAGGAPRPPTSSSTTRCCCSSCAGWRPGWPRTSAGRKSPSGRSAKRTRASSRLASPTKPPRWPWISRCSSPNRAARQELKILAAELVAVFRNLGVAREAFVALTIFERLAQAEAVTVGLLAKLSQYFSQVRNQPDLRFDSEQSLAYSSAGYR